MAEQDVTPVDILIIGSGQAGNPLASACAAKGKRVVVVGSNNSAFDICGALFEVGADVTMVQRSSTHVARSETLMVRVKMPVVRDRMGRGVYIWRSGS